MKLLFDQNLSFKLCQALADIFPGSSQVRLLGLAEADDSVLWQHARAIAAFEQDTTATCLEIL